MGEARPGQDRQEQARPGRARPGCHPVPRVIKYKPTPADSITLALGMSTFTVFTGHVNGN